MEYLRKFETKADINIDVKPNVVLVGDTGKVVYNSFKGVFIQHIDGTLYTTDEWTAQGFASDQANGVAVGNGVVKFVVAKTYGSNLKWSSDTSNAIEGIMLTDDSTIAKTDYAGVMNTMRMPRLDENNAASYCLNYVFPNGKNGYLPSAGEMNVANGYSTSIDNAMSLIGGIKYSGKYYWTSTQVSATLAWVPYDAGYRWDTVGKGVTYASSRPFLEI